jgi:membrane-associated phospholipid phosphatase
MLSTSATGDGYEGPAHEHGVSSRLWWLPLTAVGLLKDRGSRLRWLCVPGLVAVTAFVSTTAKLTIRRPRPHLGHGSPPTGRLGLASSFPSTHAACAFAIAGWMCRSRQRNSLHLLAATVGLVRVRRRVHYLSDVLAGGTLGYAIGRFADWACTELLEAFRNLRNGSKTGADRAQLLRSGLVAERGGQVEGPADARDVRVAGA